MDFVFETDSLIQIKLSFEGVAAAVINLHQKKLPQTRGAVWLNNLKQRYQRILHYVTCVPCNFSDISLSS